MYIQEYNICIFNLQHRLCLSLLVKSIMINDMKVNVAGYNYILSFYSAND